MPEPEPPDTLATYRKWHLELRCGCGRLTQIPMGLLIQRHGEHARLPALVRRMRCNQCGKPPVTAELVDDIHAGANGTGSTRRAVRRLVN